MARNETPAATVEVSADGASVEVAVATKPKQVRNLLLVSISVPQNMKDILAQIAEQEGTSVANVARARLASSLGIALAPMKRERTHKYATPEERKAATAVKAKERNNKASALLAAFEAGELSGDLAAILAKFTPKPRAHKTDGEVTPVADGEPATV